MVQFKDVEIGNIFVFTDSPERIYVKVDNENRLEIRQEGFKGASYNTSAKGADISILQVNSVSGAPNNMKVDLGYTSNKLKEDKQKQTKDEEQDDLNLFECTFKEIKIGEAFQFKNDEKSTYIKNNENSAIGIHGKDKHGIRGVDKDKLILLGDIDISSFGEQPKQPAAVVQPPIQDKQLSVKYVLLERKWHKTPTCDLCGHELHMRDEQAQAIRLEFTPDQGISVCLHCAKKVMGNIDITIQQLKGMW